MRKFLLGILILSLFFISACNKNGKVEIEPTIQPTAAEVIETEVGE